MLPQRDIFLNAYKVFSLNLLPCKTKETTLQALHRTIWMSKETFKSGMAPDPTCLRCEEPETMERLLQNIQPIYGHWLVMPLL
jgi:hypothetical protein